MHAILKVWTLKSMPCHAMYQLSSKAELRPQLFEIFSWAKAGFNLSAAVGMWGRRIGCLFLWQQIAVILTTRWYEIYAAGPPGIWVASNLLGWTNVLLVVSKSLHRINHRLRSNLKDNLADQFQMLIYPFVFTKFERRFLTINLWDIFIFKDGYADLIGMSKEGLCVSDFF